MPNFDKLYIIMYYNSEMNPSSFPKLNLNPTFHCSIFNMMPKFNPPFICLYKNNSNYFNFALNPIVEVLELFN